MQLQADHVFCVPTSVLGVASRWIINSYFSFAVLFTGVGLVQRQYYQTFLLFWAYLEADLLHHALAASFPEPKPTCSLVDTAMFLSYRQNGMPSEEAVLAATITSFLLFHQFLVKEMLPFAVEKFLFIMLPLSVLSLYASRNATAEQLIYGVLLGLMLGTYSIAVYHFFFKYHFEALIKFLRITWLVPGNATVKMAPGEVDDHDTVLLQSPG
jgi:hypothetical protein